MPEIWPFKWIYYCFDKESFACWFLAAFYRWIITKHKLLWKQTLCRMDFNLVEWFLNGRKKRVINQMFARSIIQRNTQYGRPCLFITHNVHFPNFSYSNFRQYIRQFAFDEHARGQIKKMLWSIYVGIAATPVQLKFLAMMFMLWVGRSKNASTIESEWMREWMQVVCSVCFVLHYIKYIFT